jgi:2-oxoglutarate dehydrogenase complex dehydrogenase (E1) component-like enzyme
MVHDQKTGNTFTPLNHIGAEETFVPANSHLSEYGTPL